MVRPIMTRFLTAHAARLPSTVPFTGPEALERRRGQPFRARLGANESLFGPSPRAVAAMKEAVEGVWMYADPESHDLRAAIARHHGCAPENVVVGGGIDTLLGLLCRLTLDPGTPVVTSLGAYPTFNFHVEGYGGRLLRLPYRDDAEDPAALLAAAGAEGARLLYLANPDNPMGSHHPGTVIEDLAANLPADHPQVIRLRTFSKGYGMAGARIGYALAAPELIRAFDKVRDHFGLGRVGQIGALAALQDQDWLADVRRRVEEARTRLGRIAADNGLRALPSATNFVAVDCGADGDFARRVLNECLARGLFIRMPGVAPLDRCIRISLGDAAAMAVVEDVLPQALAAVRRAG